MKSKIWSHQTIENILEDFVFEKSVDVQKLTCT